MLLETWTQVLNRSFQDLFFGLVTFIPTLIVAIAIFVIGWLIGAALGRVVAQVISSLKVDAALRSAGIEAPLRRAGIELSAGKFLGALVKWFFVVVFLVASFDVLGLTEVNRFLSDVVLGYLPQVIVAVLILLVAAVIADVMQKVVTGAARAASMRSANFLGSVTRYAIWLFAILVALDHLRVATGFVQTLFTGIVVAVSLALGLAFGLGGQQEAARYLTKMREEISDKN
jgi:hypothetical protein